MIGDVIFAMAVEGPGSAADVCAGKVELVLALAVAVARASSVNAAAAADAAAWMSLGDEDKGIGSEEMESGKFK
jgi:hypothetical protein